MARPRQRWRPRRAAPQTARRRRSARRAGGRGASPADGPSAGAAARAPFALRRSAVCNRPCWGPLLVSGRCAWCNRARPAAGTGQGSRHRVCNTVGPRRAVAGLWPPHPLQLPRPLLDAADQNGGATASQARRVLCWRGGGGCGGCGGAWWPSEPRVPSPPSRMGRAPNGLDRGPDSLLQIRFIIHRSDRRAGNPTEGRPSRSCPAGAVHNPTLAVGAPPGGHSNRSKDLRTLLCRAP
jgi:hypothetical protein